jgi:hypothetical protein
MMIYPKLTRVPILSKSLHAQFPLELIFCFRLEILKLLEPRISLAVELLQGVESPARELSSTVSLNISYALQSHDHLRHIIIVIVNWRHREVDQVYVQEH